MEYGRIVRDAWSITARTRALWWLGAISAAQVAVYAVVVGGLSAPMALMPQLASTIGSVDVGATTTASDAARGQLLLTSARWLSTHLAAIAAGAGVVFSAWLILGVLDVATQTGLVTQVDAVAERRLASFGAGLRDGFRLWWRAAVLLALAALPSLTYLLVMALIMLFTVSLPLYLGQPPKTGAALVSSLALSPLSGIVSLVGVPLGVLVQLALRFAVVDGAEWRPSFGAAWRLAKANLVEITITYAVVLLVTLLAVTVFAVIAAAAAAIVGVLLLGLALVATAGDAAAAGRAALPGMAGFAALLFLAFEAVMFVWQSAVWTLVWRDRTGQDLSSDVGGRDLAIPRSVAAITTEGGL